MQRVADKRALPTLESSLLVASLVVACNRARRRMAPVALTIDDAADTPLALQLLGKSVCAFISGSPVTLTNAFQNAQLSAESVDGVFGGQFGDNCPMTKAATRWPIPRSPIAG